MLVRMPTDTKTRILKILVYHQCSINNLIIFLMLRSIFIVPSIRKGFDRCTYGKPKILNWRKVEMLKIYRVNANYKQFINIKFVFDDMTSSL